MPGGVQTIAVPIASNETFYRGDEFVYTRSLTENLIRNTHAVVQDRRNADALLCTKLVNMRRLPLVEVEDDVVLEEGLVGTVEVSLTDRRSGRILTSFTLERRSEGYFVRGENLDTVRAKLMRELAHDTVVRLEGQSLLDTRGYPYGAYPTTRKSK
jgi:Lipopolysaccharide-assembly